MELNVALLFFLLAIVRCMQLGCLATTAVAATNNATHTSTPNTSSYADHQQIREILLGYTLCVRVCVYVCSCKVCPSPSLEREKEREREVRTP